jgi:glucose-6-phosphate-specific signal transduction histidine kinase
MFSFLREADKPDGKPGPLSARRIAAFILIFFSLPLFVLAYRHAGYGWQVYIPGGLCLSLATILFLFTTLADLKEIVQAAAAFKKLET